MKVIKKNLTFGTAMNALLKGYKITRSVWGGYWSFGNPVFMSTNNGLDNMTPMIVAHLKNKQGLAVAQPYQVDMLAHDWEIILPSENDKAHVKIGIDEDLRRDLKSFNNWSIKLGTIGQHMKGANDKTALRDAVRDMKEFYYANDPSDQCGGAN